MQQIKLKHIDNWWIAFKTNAKKISGVFNRKSNFNVVDFMNKNLEIIDRNLMWEFGPALKSNGHRLVITPEYRKDLRPLVNEILKRAPTLEGWEFYPYRLPEDFDLAKNTVEARTGEPMIELYFIAEKNKFNQIDLTFIALHMQSEEEINRVRNQGFVFTESILGEEILDKWIGIIKIETKLPEDEKYRTISEFSSSVKMQINDIKDSLPEEPFYKRMNQFTWTLYKLEPSKRDEYPTQLDIFVAKTTCIPLWENTHCEVSFTSERFSKCGEIFCYVKLDGREGLDEELFLDKSQIEDALDNALIPAGIGCHIGGGTGLHYSYIDLVLTDLAKGIKIVKDVLRKGNIPKRSWILFYDSELESEWVGIWDDSPPPPMPGFEN